MTHPYLEQLKRKRSARVSAPAAPAGRPAPPQTPGRPADAEVELNLAQVERLMATRTPRLRIYEAMAPMPTRTVDDYMARVRRRWAEAMAAQRPELIAEALARLDDLEERLVEGADKLRAEQFRAKLLGLVDKETATQVNVAVGVQAGATPAPLTYDGWTDDELAELDRLQQAQLALEAAVAARLRALPADAG